MDAAKHWSKLMAHITISRIASVRSIHAPCRDGGDPLIKHVSWSCKPRCSRSISDNNPGPDWGDHIVGVSRNAVRDSAKAGYVIVLAGETHVYRREEGRHACHARRTPCGRWSRTRFVGGAHARNSTPDRGVGGCRLEVS